MSFETERLKTKLAVILPSRGLTSIPTLAAIDRECRGIEHRHFYTHDLKLPDCFNFPIFEALHLGFTDFWIVEEDVVPPPGILQRLFALDIDIAAADYPLHVGGGQSFKMLREKLLWVSCGCTLIKSHVFLALDFPWFRTDMNVLGHISGSAGEWEILLDRGRDPNQYGGQDTVFSVRASKIGFSLGVVTDVKCDHLPVVIDQYEQNYSHSQSA